MNREKELLSISLVIYGVSYPEIPERNLSTDKNANYKSSKGWLYGTQIATPRAFWWQLWNYLLIDLDN
jgi:hypothetical protein